MKAATIEYIHNLLRADEKEKLQTKLKYFNEAEKFKPFGVPFGVQGTETYEKAREDHISAVDALKDFEDHDFR